MAGKDEKEKCPQCGKEKIDKSKCFWLESDPRSEVERVEKGGSVYWRLTVEND